VVIVADSCFAALELIAKVRRHVCMIIRLGLDASLFEPAPDRPPGQRGRPRLKGKRLAKLGAVLIDPTTVWTSVTMAAWTEVHAGIAVWYATGMPPAMIGWVLVRDPTGERDVRAFPCTDLYLEPAAILGRFVFR
jgi:DDE superfamily endonuclease